MKAKMRDALIRLAFVAACSVTGYLVASGIWYLVGGLFGGTER